MELMNLRIGTLVILVLVSASSFSFSQEGNIVVNQDKKYNDLTIGEKRNGQKTRLILKDTKYKYIQVIALMPKLLKQNLLQILGIGKLSLNMKHLILNFGTVISERVSFEKKLKEVSSSINFYT